MRKFFALASIFLSLNNSFASVPVMDPILKASEIFILIGKGGQRISLLELSRINIKDVELLRGQKMKFFDRLTFKVAQKKLRDNIDWDGSINSKKIENVLRQRGGEKGFHFGGFALGALLGPLGVLIAYLIKDDNKKNRVKWAWVGLIAFLPVYTLLYILIFSLQP